MQLQTLGGTTFGDMQSKTLLWQRGQGVEPVRARSLLEHFGEAPKNSCRL